MVRPFLAPDVARPNLLANRLPPAQSQSGYVSPLGQLPIHPSPLHIPRLLVVVGISNGDPEHGAC